MAALTVKAVSVDGGVWTTPVQITAWSGTGDTIDGSIIGDRGVAAIVSNTSGGSLDFRVEDPLTTPAGNPAANGYKSYTITNGQTVPIFIGPKNVNGTTNTVKVGASTSNAAFTVTILRY